MGKVTDQSDKEEVESQKEEVESLKEEVESQKEEVENSAKEVDEPLPAPVDDDEDDLPPPPPPVEEFPPPPLEADLPPPVDDLDSSGEMKSSSYVALVSPAGFVSPTRDETDANRRSFAHR